jgi:flagellar hook protein FlgE
MEMRNKIDLTNQNMEVMGGIQLNLDASNMSDNPFGTPMIKDGVIYMKQGDMKFAMGKIETVDFQDKHSLNPIGGNLYSKTLTSGAPILSTKTSEILTSTLELSNSDLSENLVNMMVNQRAFEANSKSITTADEFLNIAIGLKK